MQGAAEPLEQAALELVAQAPLVDDEAGVGRHREAGHLERAALRVDPHVGDEPDVRLRVLVASERDALTATTRPDVGLPPGTFRRDLEHPSCSWIVEVGEAELEGIATRRLRELVDERLHGEHVQVRAEGAQRTRAQWPSDVVGDHVERRQRVERVRVADPALGRSRPGTLRRVGAQPCRCEPIARAFRAHAVDVGDGAVSPARDAAVCIDRSREVGEHRWAVGLPAELVLDGELETHRATRHRTCGDRREGGGIVRTVEPVAAGPITVLDDDAVEVVREQRGELAAQRVDPLRVRPHRQGAVRLVGDGGGAGHRTVRLVRAGVGRSARTAVHVTLGERGVDISLATSGERVWLESAQQVLDRSGRGLAAAPAHAAGQSTHTLDRLVLTFGDDDDERSVHDDLDDPLGRTCSVEAHSLRARAERRREERAGVQHPREGHVVDVGGGTGELGRKVAAWCRGAERLLRDPGRQVVIADDRIRGKVADELGVAGASCGLVGHMHAVHVEGQRQWIDAEEGSAGLTQQAAERARSRRDGQSTVLGRQARRGVALVGYSVGRCRALHDPLVGDAEMGRSDQLEGAADALSELDASGAQLEGAIRTDAQPRVDAWRGGEGGWPRRCVGGVGRRDGQRVPGRRFGTSCRPQRSSTEPVVRAAAADVLVERVEQRRVIRIRVCRHRRGDRHDHAVDAVAALRRLLIEEGLLHRMGLLGPTESLRRDDLTTHRLSDGRQARADGLVTEDDGAGTAFADRAAGTDALEVELVAQHVHQGCRVGHVRSDLASVDAERDGHQPAALGSMRASSSSRSNTHAMERLMRVSAISWRSTPRMLAQQSRTTIGR